MVKWICKEEGNCDMSNLMTMTFWGIAIVLLLGIFIGIMILLNAMRNKNKMRVAPVVNANVNVPTPADSNQIAPEIVAVITGAIAAFGETGEIKSITPVDTPFVNETQAAKAPVFKRRPAWSRAGIDASIYRF